MKISIYGLYSTEGVVYAEYSYGMSDNKYRRAIIQHEGELHPFIRVKGNKKFYLDPRDYDKNKGFCIE